MPCFAIWYRDERKCCNWLNCIHVCIRRSKCLHDWLDKDQHLQHGTQSKILWSIIFAPRLASFYSNCFRTLSGSDFLNWSEYNRSCNNLLFGRANVKLSCSWPNQNNSEQNPCIMSSFAIWCRDWWKCYNRLNCIHVLIECAGYLHDWIDKD